MASLERRISSQELPPSNFLYPERGNLPAEIPTGGAGIRRLVDALRPNAPFPPMHPPEAAPRTLDEVAYVVRNRYPETTKQINAIYQAAVADLNRDPHDPAVLARAKQAIALTGAFNYVRGIQVLRKIDPTQEVPHDNQGIPTGNVHRDTDIIPNMTLSPSALLQLQERAQIGPDDKVLYLCAGAGGGIFFTAATRPKLFDAVDLYTPDYYDLEGTFALGKQEIYAKVPSHLKPDITKPNFIKADADRLPIFGSPEAAGLGFRTDAYDKIIFHPPYGRDSMLAETMEDITEADGFMMWLSTTLNLNQINKKNAQVFSIVPPEWGRAVNKFMEGRPLNKTIEAMYAELRGLRYYEGDNAAKLAKPYNQDTMHRLDAKREEVANIFRIPKDQRTNLDEMGMFPLQINVIPIAGH